MNRTQNNGMTTEELQKITVTKNDDSTVTIEGEVPFAYLEAERANAVAHLSEGITIDGFRKGNIPEKVLVDRVGEMTILSEMAERALNTAYTEILKAHEIDAIGYPKIEITKIAKGNPLGFKAIVAVYPEVKLPDYKAIAQDVNAKKESDEVTDAEVEDQVKDILRQKAAYERLQQKAQSGETHTHADGTVHQGPAHDEALDHGADEPVEDIKDLPLPELTDELVKTFGQPGQFEGVSDFKTKIREHLEIQKKQDNISKHRAAITDSISEKTQVKIPQVMIDAELNQMFAQMEEDLSRAQLKIEDYLAHMKKTRDDLRKEWAPAAEKRAKLQLVLNEIAKKENISADEKNVEEEVSRLLEHYKDADKHRVEVYVRSVLTNEAVMQKLENL
jgi:trigger factor